MVVLEEDDLGSKGGVHVGNKGFEGLVGLPVGLVD